MTLRRLLFDMGFFYEKNGNKSILVERDQKNLNLKPNLSKPCNKKSSNNCSSNSNDNANNGQFDTINNPSKTVPQLHHENNTTPLNHMHQVNSYQNHRIMHMHVPQPNHHMIPPRSQHSVPMMINHRNDFIPTQHPHPPQLIQIRSSDMNIGVKRDNSVWMQQAPPPLTPLTMIKQ
ncbi:ribosomal protein l7ae family member [Holotrichia oblita]|nr:ribosomal protein l7ae family member [Holotrichia oblita]